eukprot:PhF_6_TR40890/c0_g1_i2/m.61838/K10364/CAPZA; capping protein (actin filament) muscle Z-line, alpha
MSLSAEDKTAIVTKFIRSAPPHEVTDVLKATRALLSDDALFDKIAPGAVRDYNIENQVCAQFGAGTPPVVLTSHNYVSDDTFFNPRDGTTFTVDPFTLKAEVVEQKSQTSKYAALQGKLDTYFSQHFKSGGCNVFEDKGASDKLYVCMNAEKSNVTNKWSGRWMSTYTITMPTSDTAKVQGAITCHVHYYEEGNIQMVATHTVNQQISGADEAECMAKVAKAIEKGDGEFQVKLEETCQTLGGTSLKALRRPLPVTKQLFDFASRGHKLAKELGGVSK